MYTRCLIQWQDSLKEEEVVIKDHSKLTDKDEGFFRRGYTPHYLKCACVNGWIMDTGWKVLKIIEVFDDNGGNNNGSLES